MRSSEGKNREGLTMIPRWFVVLAMMTAGCATEAMAQSCPNPLSDGGICPVFVQGDASCADAAQICGVALDPLQPPVVFAPPAHGSSCIDASFVGTKVDVKDNCAASQQLGRPGMEIIIARRNGSYVYCGTEILRDLVRAPGTSLANQVTICFAEGPCDLAPTQVINACSPYGGTANFLQAYRVGPIEQDVNLCGCGDYAARFCDIRQPRNVGSPPSASFVACNPDSSALKSVEAEGTATIGGNTCIMRTIGGRRVLIDSTTGTYCTQ